MRWVAVGARAPRRYVSVVGGRRNSRRLELFLKQNGGDRRGSPRGRGRVPEYPHAGSGWFRIRWVYAAIQKSVLLSSQKDLDALGLPKVNVEQLGDAELEDYANQLSETVLSYMWTKDVFDTRIKEIVEAVGENLTISSQPTVGISKQTALF